MSEREKLRREIQSLEQQARNFRAVNANYAASVADRQIKKLRALLNTS